MNGWKIEFGEGLFFITDPGGELCVAKHLRFLNKDTFVIGHPILADRTVNTFVDKALGPCWKGQLDSPENMGLTKRWLQSRNVDYRGPYHQPRSAGVRKQRHKSMVDE